MVSYNNTEPMWGKTAEEVFHSHVEYTKTRVIANISETLNYDLGNYTESYNSMLTQVIFYSLRARETLARLSL